MSDENGIKNTFRRLKKTYTERKIIFVFFVLRSIYLTEISLLSFVLIIAKQTIERNRELMTRKELVLAEMITYAINTHSKDSAELVSKEYS